MYLDAGNHDLALENLEKSLDFSKDYALTQVTLGNLYFDKNDLEKSQKYHLEAIEVNPNELQALIGAGNAFYQMENT